MVRLAPKSLFNPDYPENPGTFGEALRKARIDAGLTIKGLARQIDVTPDSIINWEIRGMKPAPLNMKAVAEKFPMVAAGISCRY